MSARVHFGHCVGCDQPIRPPYLSFDVHFNTYNKDDGNSSRGWEEADVCGDCAAKLTVADFFKTVTAEDEQEATDAPA
jgi:hypothetical protein